MAKQPKGQGVSVAQYARSRRVNRSLIYRLLAQGRMTRLPSGMLDPATADQERTRTTRPRMTPVTAAPTNRAQSDCAGRRICRQCQDPAGFTREEAVTLASPDPARFCWRKCASDFAGGKSTEATRREFAESLLEDGGWTRRELELDGYLTWL
jgi:hypothetical protein